LPLYGRFGYANMTKFLMIQIILSCRSSTGVQVCSVYGHLFSGWGIETYLQRSVHNWRLRRGILFPNIDDHIIYGLVRRSNFRHFTLTLYDM
jgi:hypothetical protein